MVKTRGLKEANKKLGNVERVINNMLKSKKQIWIFEAGCGYGRLMMDIAVKYRDKVEIVGMNLKKIHGTKEIMIFNAIKEGVINKEDLKKIKIPKIIYGDAGEKLPFKTDSIDLVLSQTSTYLFKDKLHFFEEVARVLRKKGIARVTPPENPKIPKEFQPLLKLYEDNKEISFDKFIRSYKKIRLVKTSKGKVIEIQSGILNFKAKLEATINVNHINKKWFGVQSIYYVNK